MKSLLLVEDSLDLRNQIEQALSQEGGFKVEVAGSGEEGYQKLSNNSYDVIVLDYHLPEYNGIDILRKLKDEGKPVTP